MTKRYIYIYYILTDRGDIYLVITYDKIRKVLKK